MSVPDAYPLSHELIDQVVGVQSLFYHSGEIRFKYEAEIVHNVEPVDPCPRIAGLYHRIHYVGHGRKLDIDDTAALRQTFYVRITPVDVRDHIIGGYADTAAFTFRLFYGIYQHFPVREPSVICEFPACRPEPFDLPATVEVRYDDLSIMHKRSVQTIKGNAYVDRTFRQLITAVPDGPEFHFIHRRSELPPVGKVNVIQPGKDCRLQYDRNQYPFVYDF